MTPSMATVGFIACNFVYPAGSGGGGGGGPAVAGLNIADVVVVPHGIVSLLKVSLPIIGGRKQPLMPTGNMFGLKV